jgi:phenylalanyl-tRNA synthetase alpha chain
MILYSIPDIRLFWSDDARFVSQFKPGEIASFVPYSKYPAAARDMSFWRPHTLHDNDVYDLVRDVAGDLVEDVVVVDTFTHPTTGRQSALFRVNYRSMDRSLIKAEINALHERVCAALVAQLGVELR